MFLNNLSNNPVERRVIFRPYSSLGQRADVYVCVGCGKHFAQGGDMEELATRFAEHLCEPAFTDECEPGPTRH